MAPQAVYAVAGSVALLAALRSPFQLICALVVGAACAVHPTFRDVADSLLGHATPRTDSLRLDDHQPTPRAAYRGDPDERPGQLVQLDVPDHVTNELDELLKLIIRDFVAWWYNASISLGDDRFLQETRSNLNAFVNQSVTTALIREMRKQKDEESYTDDQRAKTIESEKVRLIKRIRSASEEVLFTFSPRSATASAAASTLLTEILTVQTYNTIVSIDADRIAQTVVSYLEAAPEIIATTQAQAELAQAGPGPHSADTSSAAGQTPQQSAETAVKSSKAILKTYLDGDEAMAEDQIVQMRASKPIFMQQPLSSGARHLLEAFETPTDGFVDSFERHLQGLDPEVSRRGQALTRSLERLLSFERILALSSMAPDVLRRDTFALLYRVNEMLDAFYDPRDLDDVLSASIEAGSSIPLRDWILHRLEEDYWPAFDESQRLRRSQGPATGADPSHALPQPPQERRPLKFSVSVTDLSPPNAYDAKGIVRNRQALSFMVAVEVAGQPGFIIQRSQNDLEKLDSGLHRLFPQAGTAEFPRIVLPSTAHRNSEAVCAGLSAFLESLLSDPRYAGSAPVGTFFERERALGGAAPAFNLLDLADGVNKGLLRTGDLATRGLSSGLGAIGQIVSAPLSFLAEADNPSRRSSMPYPSSSLPYKARTTRAPSVPSTPAPARGDSTSKLPDPSAMPHVTSEAEAAGTRALRSPSLSAPGQIVPGPKQPLSSRDAPGEGFSAGQARKASAIKPKDLDRILLSCMALLESAYDLVEGQWSLRRGMIRVIETIVRTTSLASLEVALASSMAACDARTIARKLKELRVSFWPGGVWYASSDVVPAIRSDAEKRKTALAAQRLITQLAPDSLRLALGPAATTEAFGRMSRALVSDTSFRVVAAVVLDMMRLLIL